ncbi:MAG: replicative DNA helicase [Alphaproteobacteria bacterium]
MSLAFSERSFADDAPTYRTPPHNTEIEAALLGAILTNNRAYERVSDFLLAEHFYEPVLGRIYAAAAKLIESGQVASPLTLQHHFASDPALAEVGGAQYLYDLAASVVTVINATDYGRSIYDLHVRRELIQLGESMVNEAYDADIDDTAQNQIGRSEARLYELATTGEAERATVSLAVATKHALIAAEEAFKRDIPVVGVATGFRDLDRMLGGLHPSDLIILAARPSMGKTALSTNIAFNAAKAFKERIDERGRAVTEGGYVLFFSLEMSAEQLATRLLAEQGQVPSDRIRRGEISDEQFERVVVASQELNRAPMFIDDTPALSISALRTRARRLKRQKRLDLIIVDYLQLLQGSSSRRNENRVQEISEITRGLKTLAKELEVPVIALSQLSRQVEHREVKRPQLSDLRESGTIEQDADVVMFIYREEYYLEREAPAQRDNESIDKFNERRAEYEQRLAESRGIAEVIIAKQRHGPVGTVRMLFDGELTKFMDADLIHHDPDAR